MKARAAASDWSRISSTARLKVGEAVFVGELCGEVAPEQAARELRGDVAEQLLRHPRVVLDDAVDFLDRLALRP